jgi:hypothetical protein
VFLFWTLKRSIKIIFNVEDQINESLDLLDDSYAKLNKISQTPVLFDDPQIKLAIKELLNAKNSILLVANKMTNNMNQIDPVIDEKKY